MQLKHRRLHGRISCLAWVALGFVGLLVWMIFAASPSGTTPSGTARVVPVSSVPARPPTHAGDVCTIEVPGASTVWMATNETDWTDFLDAQNDAVRGGRGSMSQLARMAEAGRARVYAKGTKVRVLKTTFLSRHVEVLEGDDQGRTGWVQVEFVSLAR